MMNSEQKLKDEMTEQYGSLVKEKLPDDMNYLVIQRSLLEGLPEGLQKRFVGILEEIEDIYDMRKVHSVFQVSARGMSDSGKLGAFVKDPLADWKSKPKLPYRKER